MLSNHDISRMFRWNAKSLKEILQWLKAKKPEGLQITDVNHPV